MSGSAVRRPSLPLCHEFVANVAADARINKFFALTASDPKRMATFKGNLVDQICQAGGGPCTYAGKSMKEAHAGMGVSTADFKALVEDLVKALDKLKVGEKEKNELLSVLGPMKSDIVEKPERAREALRPSTILSRGPASKR